MFKAAENQDAGVPAYNLAACYHGSEAAAPITFCSRARSISSSALRRSTGRTSALSMLLSSPEFYFPSQGTVPRSNMKTCDISFQATNMRSKVSKQT